MRLTVYAFVKQDGQLDGRAIARAYRHGEWMPVLEVVGEFLGTEGRPLGGRPARPLTFGDSYWDNLVTRFRESDTLGTRAILLEWKSTYINPSTAIVVLEWFSAALDHDA